MDSDQLELQSMDIEATQEAEHLHPAIQPTLPKASDDAILAETAQVSHEEIMPPATDTHSTITFTNFISITFHILGLILATKNTQFQSRIVDTMEYSRYKNFPGYL